MAITNGYCTLAELKARLDILDDKSDTILEQNIEAASRKIDGWCGRSFYSATATRYFTPEQWDVLDVPDLVSVTTLKTDEDGDRTYETTWTASDYELDPDTGPPYTRVYVTPSGYYAFPVGMRRSVQIVGTWGWSTVPHSIREATLILAARYFKRKDSPMGAQIGNTEMGNLTIPANDADVTKLVSDYRRFALVGV